MKLAFSIASRFIVFSKAQSFFIVLGIAVGVAVLVFVGVLIDSLQGTLINRTVGGSPHISITHDSGEIRRWERVLRGVEMEPGLTKVYPVVDGNAFLLTQDKTYPVRLRGFTFEPENDIYNIEDNLIDGRTPRKAFEVVVGKDLRDDAEIELDDYIAISVAGGGTRQFNVVGFFDLKVANPNRLWLLSNQKTVQEMLQIGNKITEIELQVSDVFAADTIAEDIASGLDDEFDVSDWKAENGQLLSGLEGQSMSTVMIQIFVLLSVIIAITSVLSITVTQKSRQIGILKAMGITDAESSDIFVFQGFMLGLLGTVVGMAMGLGMFILFVKFAKGADGVPLVDPIIRWSYAFGAGMAALIAASAAGLIPAMRSKRLDPIDIIRNG